MRNSRALFVEQLEDRCLLDGSPGMAEFQLGKIEQISGESLLKDVTTDLPQKIGAPQIDAEAIPLVAVNPADSDHIVIAWSQDEWTTGAARGLGVAVTFDGGKDWQNVDVPGLTRANGGELDRATDPRIAIGADGSVYAGVIAGVRHPSFVKEDMMLFVKSPDGGLTWNEPVLISQNSTPGKFGHHPYITVDPNDSNVVYYVWAQFNSQNSQTQIRKSTDGGATFGDTVVVNQRPAWDTEGVDQLFVHPDGTLMMAFTEKVFDPSVVSVSLSHDGGATWSEPLRGPEFDTPTVVDPETGQGVWSLARHGKSGEFAMDASGTLYAVWEDGRFSAGSHTDVAFAMSTDQGQTWTDPIRINKTPNDIAVGNRQAYLPSIAVADDGTVGVAHYDYRNNTPDAGLLTDYWFVSAHPNDDLTDANNWQELRLTDQSFDLQPSPTREGILIPALFQATGTADNDFLPVWVQPHDDGNGGIDPASVFTRRVNRIGMPALSLSSSDLDPVVEQLALALASSSNELSLQGSGLISDVNFLGNRRFGDVTDFGGALNQFETGLIDVRFTKIGTGGELNGTLSLTANNGDTLLLSISLERNGDAFVGTYEIEEGTGTFEDAVGSGAMTLTVSDDGNSAVFTLGL